ncbi:hypothetical protein [Pseudomonas sp. H1h]|uniref:hypothetical protein n=1 Tax=Pseudomonas sp. H1h TaxID=1397280 RepID=UPI0004689144|nr:hypothetical protein [Pseudomonas sp. H1h]
MKMLGKSACPGDFFYIPAYGEMQQQGFVIARFIENVSGNLGYLIEVFERFYTTPPGTREDVDIRNRLFKPVLCSFRFSEVPKWRVLFSDPDYDRAQSNYDDIKFLFYSSLWVGGKDIPQSQWSGSLSIIEEAVCWRTLHLIFRVNAHLAGIFGADEPYDYDRLPNDLREDNPAAIARVVSLAQAMDDKFKAWAAESKKKK